MTTATSLDRATHVDDQSDLSPPDRNAKRLKTDAQSPGNQAGALLGGLRDLSTGRKNSLFVIRHGETPDNRVFGSKIRLATGDVILSKGKVLSGKNDIGLTRTGWEQAKVAGRRLREHPDAEKLRNLEITKWICSPLRRTRETLLGVLAGFCGDDEAMFSAILDSVEYIDGIAERDPGEDLRNKTWYQAGEIWPEMKKERDASVFHEVDARYPGENGESVEIVNDRSMPPLLKAFKSYENVVEVGHEVTISGQITELVDGVLSNKAFARKVDNAKPIKMSGVDGKWNEPEPDTSDGRWPRPATL